MIAAAGIVAALVTIYWLPALEDAVPPECAGLSNCDSDPVRNWALSTDRSVVVALVAGSAVLASLLTTIVLNHVISRVQRR